ncbi:LysE family translocator [Leucobacter insecticola]|uniref:LysE family translocator n=1 Tax=Leucobacter insecticola TaxID=2714934 RepID=A0A6G8FJY2_9MICO|nr:LysE family translocator [Leucobacter insecticola]QIM16746.1 LysE family translocator [Leucobacter insecticola]
MVSLENLLAFGIAAVILIVIPGPSVLFTIGRTLALGRLGGLLSVIGNSLGSAVIAAAVALGIGTLVSQSIILFSVVKYAGAAYMVFLGVQAIRHRHSATETTENPVRLTWQRQILQGFVVGVSNPKSIAFFIAVLPQFVSHGEGSVQLQMLELGLLFSVLAALCDSVWAMIAGVAREWFGKSPERMAGMSATGGGFMIALGAVLALTGQRHLAL